MIIVGAGGFAKEVLSCISNPDSGRIRFFDDVNPKNLLVFGTYEILKNETEVKSFFKNNQKDFTIGIGNPKLRKKLYDRFIKLDGRFVSTISSKSFIGDHDVQLAEGLNILSGVNISNNVCIGKGTMIYYSTNITHDCKIGEFVEIAPGVQILGRVKIGDFVTIGSGAVILPDVFVGNHAIIGAGAVVTKDVLEGQTVIGIPAKPLIK